MLFQDDLLDFLMAILQSLTPLKQGCQQKIGNAKQPSSDIRLLIDKKTCIERHPRATEFLTYRILYQPTKSAAG